MGTVKRLVLVVAFAAIACAGPSTGAPAVRIVFTQTPPELAFDPTDLRLRAAQAQLAELLGHPLAIDIDAALFPQWQGSFQHLLVEAIENVARDARQLREQRPAAFDEQLAKLVKIQCRYVASRAPHDERSELSADGSTLIVYSTADARDLVPRGIVLGQVTRAYEAQKHAQFGKATPDSVATGELGAYFRDLSSRYDRGEKTPAESVRAEAISRIIELEARANGELRDEIRRFLVGTGANFFAAAYVHQGAAVRSYPNGSRFRNAERDFAKWVNATQKALPADQRLALLKELYPRPFTQNREPGRSFVSFAFPAANRDDILFDVLDEWVAAGHPMPSYGRPRNGTKATAVGPKPKPLHEWVVCPRPKSPEGPRSLGPHCDDTLYLRAMEEPAVAARLHQTLLTKKDAVLTETVFANLAQSSRVEFAIAAWTRLGDAADDGNWKIAAEVLAEELAANAAPPCWPRRLTSCIARANGIAAWRCTSSPCRIATPTTRSTGRPSPRPTERSAPPTSARSCAPVLMPSRCCRCSGPRSTRA